MLKQTFFVLSPLVIFIAQASAKQSVVSSSYFQIADKNPLCIHKPTPDAIVTICEPTVLKTVGLKLELAEGDDGSGLLIFANDKKITWDQMYEGFNTAQPSIVSDSPVEIRSQTVNGESRPFALIFRRALIDPEKGTSKSSLLVVKLDGANSKVIANTDSNIEARKIADALLKK